MQQDMDKAYKESVDFWDSAYAMTEEEKEEALKEGVAEDDWRGLAPSPTILKFVELISDCDKFLDYGCGYGWASIAAAKSGCKDVTAVEVVKNAVDLTEFYSKLYGVGDRVKTKLVDYDWMGNQPEGSFDGFFCGNVLDVVPMKSTRSILTAAKKILKKGARIIVTMNYYAEPKDDPERNIKFEEGKYLFVNGVLRMMSLTDDEWKELLGEYFTVVEVVHFAWPGEEEEKRRLFYLTND